MRAPLKVTAGSGLALSESQTPFAQASTAHLLIFGFSLVGFALVKVPEDQLATFESLILSSDCASPESPAII